MRRLLPLVALLIACAAPPRPIVVPERLPLLAACEALAVARDRAWEAAWTWDEQMAVLRDFWRVADAAGCAQLGPEWRI